nr:MAG TPA: hypothetical protein [Caudoviricetes sp.]
MSLTFRFLWFRSQIQGLSMFMTWNCHQFDSLRSLIFRGNVNDVNAFRVLECCRET